MSCKFDNTYCFLERELLRVDHSTSILSPHANLVHIEKVWLCFHNFEFRYWDALQNAIRFVKHVKKQKNKEARTMLFVAVETHALA